MAPLSVIYRTLQVAVVVRPAASSLAETVRSVCETFGGSNYYGPTEPWGALALGGIFSQGGRRSLRQIPWSTSQVV